MKISSVILMRVLPQRKVADVLQSLKNEIQGLAEVLDPNRQASELLAAELRARREVRGIREESRIARPRGVGLSREVRQSWEAYRSEFLKLDEICFGPAESEIAETIRHHAQRTRLLIDQRERLETALNQNVRDARQRTRRESDQTRQEGREVSERVVQLTRQVMIDVESTIRQVLTDVARLELSAREESDLVEVRANFEDIVDQATGKALSDLASMRDQLRGMSWTPDSDGTLVTQLDILEANRVRTT